MLRLRQKLMLWSLSDFMTEKVKNGVLLVNDDRRLRLDDGGSHLTRVSVGQTPSMRSVGSKGSYNPPRFCPHHLVLWELRALLYVRTCTRTSRAACVRFSLWFLVSVLNSKCKYVVNRMCKYKSVAVPRRVNWYKYSVYTEDTMTWKCKQSGAILGVVRRYNFWVRDSTSYSVENTQNNWLLLELTGKQCRTPFGCKIYVFINGCEVLPRREDRGHSFAIAKYHVGVNICSRVVIDARNLKHPFLNSKWLVCCDSCGPDITMT